jgi:TolB-like protein/Tfp pilus assembly protein PilF
MANGEPPPLNPKAPNAVGEQLGKRLDSWKEIASWLDRSEKTARRWEQREGMPVHRLLHEKRGTIYAYSAELEAWRQSRKITSSEEEEFEDQAQRCGRTSSESISFDLIENGLTQAAEGNPNEPAAGGPGSSGYRLDEPIKHSGDLGPAYAASVPTSVNGHHLAELPGDVGLQVPTSGSSLQQAEIGATKARIEWQPQEGGSLSRSRLWLKSAAVCALLVGAIIWYASYRDASHRSGEEQPPINSVAVLPLTDLAADTSEGYFADGMTEELITELGSLSSIHIISRTSIMQFKKSIRSLPEIGRQLNVDAVVEGTVRRSGGRVRITARLVSTAQEHLIWQKEYEGDMRDILMLQSDVAHDIAGNIQTKLARQQVPGAVAYKRLDPETHEDYLRGRYFLARRTAEGMNTAVDYFQRAVQRDPHYAQAYVGLASAYELLGSYELLPPDKSFPLALKFANKALELDDTLSEAYSARANAKCNYEFDWAAADRDFRRAIALDPNSALAHHDYGEYFTVLGNSERAIAELKIARELDPLSLPLFNTIGRMYREAHQYDEAIKQCKQSLVLDPNFSMGHWCLGQVYLAKRQYPEATSELRLANELGTTPLIVADLGCVYAASGKKTEARAILHSLESKSQFNYVSPYLIATIYSQLGEKDEAFKWLERAYDARDISYVVVDPMMDPLHSDPRFAHLIQRLHLPDRN